ncbi:WEB family protein At2g17940-like [Musa acuminata AAA Group]|uniref:WEB family protein At2g17940-like n=1 Tax=Musa acuminata AAA Group TaxID=214697 RepID=UPI0031E0024F
MESGEGGRVEIDTSAPFGSVKEAVMLFGERVLAGEVYANRLNEIRAAANRKENERPSLGSMIAELEDTKQNLEKAKEERSKMVSCLTSLAEELERTKMELKQLKAGEHERKVKDIEIEDVKFVEKADQVGVATPSGGRELEFQKRRYVTFANPPSLARVLSAEEQVLERQFSVAKENAPGKKKKKSFMPWIAALFTGKKDRRQGSAAFGRTGGL